MLSPKFIRCVLCISAFSLLGGCGNGTGESEVRSAQVSFDEALAKEASGELSGALPLIEAALSDDGLNPDQLAEALLLRARCYCASGALDKAQADIEMADQGAPNPAKLHLTRGMLLDKQGKAAEAKAEYNLAKRADPSIKIP
jgi:tetratricopeptide (TPR) repeat protein